MKSAIFLPVLVALTACATDQIVVKEAKEVLVPVQVPCKVAIPPRPSFKLDGPEVRGAGLFYKGNAALIEIEQHRQYERELEAALQACTADISPAQ
jgi:hypothetical protein